MKDNNEVVSDSGKKNPNLYVACALLLNVLKPLLIDIHVILFILSLYFVVICSIAQCTSFQL